MSYFIVLVWCIVLLFVSRASSVGDQLSLPVKTDSRVQLSSGRAKRIAFYIPIGDKAVKQILKGAVRMPQRTKNRNEYVKEGGFQTAVKDFKKAKPHNIRYSRESDSTIVQVGTVGDRTIILKGTVPGDRDARPTVTIVKSEQANDPDAVFDVITYYFLHW